MRKIQIALASVGALGLVGVVGACGSDSSDVSTGGDASVTVDGKAVDLASKTVVCTEQGGKLIIAVGDSGGAGVGATLTTGDSPEAETVGLGSTNGVSLGWTKMVPGAGEAKVSKDGKSYTISGTASGVDPANPMTPVKKPFEIKVTCP